MVQSFNGKVRFVSENYGDSRLARRFGVSRYPAIFVDSVLVATPNDFGFYGSGGGSGGRYAPLRSAAAHQRFRDDLTRMIDLLLAGQGEAARAVAKPASSTGVASLPAVKLTALDGTSVDLSRLGDRVVLVEFWATWCPPCRGTLGWLGDLQRRYGDRLSVVALAVESEEPAVRRVTREMGLPLTWGMATPEIARAFGDVSAVPTLMLFDRQGKAAGAFYGAPPTLHPDAEAKLAALIGAH